MLQPLVLSAPPSTLLTLTAGDEELSVAAAGGNVGDGDVTAPPITLLAVIETASLATTVALVLVFGAITVLL